MDSVIFASRTVTRLELVPVARLHNDGRGELPAWRARLTGAGLDVSVACPEAAWEPKSLADFLDALAEAERGGWDGERTWQSEEGELLLAVRRDKKNTVLVGVDMKDGARWRCQAELELDPGVFRQLAADARRLAAVSLTL